jgi:diguanylate cyclase (GGDEF)-like protein
MKSRDSYSDVNPKQILLVGDIGRAFLDVDSVAEERFEICADIPAAIEVAARNNFAAIAIVMSGLPAKLSSALKSLKDNCGVRVILLAQMYEEPIAMQLVNSTGSSIADDYLICPIRLDELYESALNSPRSRLRQENNRVIEASVSAIVAPATRGGGATAEMRIKHLEKLATEDDLTGLKNRRYIWEFSRQIIEHAKKENGQVTLLVFDIDDFKHYNDVYGHSAGDEILRQAAVLMKRCCRSHDVVGRIGGDEFAVVFWDDPKIKTQDVSGKGTERRSATAGHPKEAVFITKRLVRELENAELSALGGLGPEGKGVLTISGGLASFPRDGQTIQELFQQADKALLEAKKSGKNRIYLVGKPQSNINDIN